MVNSCNCVFLSVRVPWCLYCRLQDASWKRLLKDRIFSRTLLAPP